MQLFQIKKKSQNKHLLDNRYRNKKERIYLYILIDFIDIEYLLQVAQLGKSM